MNVPNIFKTITITALAVTATTTSRTVSSTFSSKSVLITANAIPKTSSDFSEKPFTKTASFSSLASLGVSAFFSYFERIVIAIVCENVVEILSVI